MRKYSPRQPPVSLVCAHCGKQFRRRVCDLRIAPRQFCSRECLNDIQRNGATEGGKKTPEYTAWQHIWQRCENPNVEKYHCYGGRGINVAPEWRSFARFLADMGPRPGPRFEIDRIDNEGDYGPGNCRWTTRREQMNNIRKNVLLQLDGERMTASQWARRLGIPATIICGRLASGWSDRDALLAPIGKLRDPKTGRFIRAPIREE